MLRQAPLIASWSARARALVSTPALAAARSSYRPAAKGPREDRRAPAPPFPCGSTKPATVFESLSTARALRTQPCQRAAKGLSSIAWTRHHTLARGLKATNRLLLPAPATKQEPPTEDTTPDLDMVIIKVALLPHLLRPRQRRYKEKKIQGLQAYSVERLSKSLNKLTHARSTSRRK